jgi:hypothetical protein
MTPDEILIEAARLVGGERSKKHGEYIAQHQRVADLWSAYLGVEVSAANVAFCMTLIKISRSEIGEHNPDDGVDAAAYVALWAALSRES